MDQLLVNIEKNLFLKKVPLMPQFIIIATVLQIITMTLYILRRKLRSLIFAKQCILRENTSKLSSNFHKNLKTFFR